MDSVDKGKAAKMAEIEALSYANVMALEGTAEWMGFYKLKFAQEYLSLISPTGCPMKEYP